MAKDAKQQAEELVNQNNLLINKLLGKFSDFFTGEAKEKKQERAVAKGAAPERASFRQTSYTVQTGIKRGSTIVGPGVFWDKLFAKLAPGDDGEDPIPKKLPPWWKDLLGPALLILGGLAAFIKGIMTDGPLKGFLALLAKGGIMGGLQLLSKVLGRAVGAAVRGLGAVFGDDAVKGVLQSLRSKVGAIFKPVSRFFLSTLPKFFIRLIAPALKLVGIGGKDIFKVVLRSLGFIAKNLRFIPFIGALISWAFAYSRFKSGDVIGGAIDLVAGFTSFLPPPIGIPLSIGLGILNAVLDAKSGGATGKQQQAKGDMLKRWGKKIFELAASVPPISNVYHLANAIIQGVSGNWKAAANHFMWSIPLVGDVLRWFDIGGFKTETGEPIRGDKNTFWARFKSFIYGMSPIAQLVGVYKGIKYALQGQWKLAATSLVYGIPFVSTVIDWFGGPSTAEEAVEDMGNKNGFFQTIKNYMLESFPIKNLVQFVTGVKSVLTGDVAKGFLDMGYALPLFSSISSWLGGPASGDEAKETLGDKTSFWSRVKQLVYGMSPISWIIGIGKGIKYAVQGKWQLAGSSLVYGIPMLSTVIAWLGGPATAEEAVEDIGNKDGFFQSIKNYILGMYPVRNFVQFGAGIRKIIGGQIMSGLTDAAYAIPLLGKIAGWLGGPETAEEAQADLGTKNGFFNSIKNWIMERYPVKNLLQFGQGIGQIFGGEFIGGLSNMAYSVPFFGSLVSFFGGPETAQEAQQQIATNGSGFFKSFRDRALRKVLGWVPKSVLGVSVRSRVAKILGINMSEPIRDDNIAGEADKTAKTIDTSSSSLNKASQNISKSTKKIEDASASFGKSSPGVWEYLDSASEQISSNIKNIIKSSFVFVDKLSRGIRFLGGKGFVAFTRGLEVLLKTPIRHIARGIAKSNLAIDDMFSSLVRAINSRTPDVLQKTNDFISAVVSLLKQSTASVSNLLFNRDVISGISVQQLDQLKRQSASLSTQGKDVNKILKLIEQEAAPAGSPRAVFESSLEGANLAINNDTNKVMRECCNTQRAILNELQNGTISAILGEIRNNTQQRDPLTEGPDLRLRPPSMDLPGAQAPAPQGNPVRQNRQQFVPPPLTLN